jgi:hypothetical protein
MGERGGDEALGIFMFFDVPLRGVDEEEQEERQAAPSADEEADMDFAWSPCSCFGGRIIRQHGCCRGGVDESMAPDEGRGVLGGESNLLLVLPPSIADLEEYEEVPRNAVLGIAP